LNFQICRKIRAKNQLRSTLWLLDIPMNDQSAEADAYSLGATSTNSTEVSTMALGKKFCWMNKNVYVYRLAGKNKSMPTVSSLKENRRLLLLLNEVKM
jgi:hypothetical protein